MRSKKSPERIQHILQFIEEYQKENGVSPSNREIAEGTGYPPVSVSRYLQYMKEQNMISFSGCRSITLNDMTTTYQRMVSVPVVGDISCGTPYEVEENIEEYIRLPSSMFGSGNYFLLRANGDSMIDAGIEKGDLVLIRQQNTANEGEIVVALIDNETTLKRFYYEPLRRQIRLHPENEQYEDRYYDEIQIQGIAVKVIKIKDLQ